MATSKQGPLSSVPKVAVVERFNCNLSAVARLDLLGEANHERRRGELLGVVCVSGVESIH